MNVGAYTNGDCSASRKVASVSVSSTDAHKTMGETECVYSPTGERWLCMLSQLSLTGDLARGLATESEGSTADHSLRTTTAHWPA